MPHLEGKPRHEDTPEARAEWCLSISFLVLAGWGLGFILAWLGALGIASWILLLNALFSFIGLTFALFLWIVDIPGVWRTPVRRKWMASLCLWVLAVAASYLGIAAVSGLLSVGAA